MIRLRRHDCVYGLFWVMADAKGETYFEGYIAGESAETLMIVGRYRWQSVHVSNGD